MPAAHEPEPDILIAGERAALGPVRLDLAETYARWENSAELRFGLEQLGIYSERSQTQWVEEHLDEGAKEEPRSAAFTIYDRDDLAPVGTAILFSISYRSRSARFGIGLGERRGQGLGTDATRLAVDWAFHVLGLNSVLLEALATNAAAIAAYERAGFKRIGTRRAAALLHGEPADVVMMDAVRADFGPSHLI
jgi:diamine N-acetyltransferase